MSQRISSTSAFNQKRIWAFLQFVLSQYWTDLKHIASDLTLPYRNFFHWNFSKIMILLSGMALSILLSLPFFFVIWYFLPSGTLGNLVFFETIDPELFNTLASNLVNLVIVAIAIVMIFTIFTVVLSYGYLFLTVRVYDSYFRWEKLPIRANLYWNKKYILKFLGVLGWASLYLSIPVVIGLAILLVLFLLLNAHVLDPYSSPTQSIVLSGVVFTSLAILTAAMVVIAIRATFGYMLMLSEKSLALSGRVLARKSFALSRGKVIRILFLVIPAMLIPLAVSLGLNYVKVSLDISSLETRINTAAASDPQTFKDDHEYVAHNYIHSVVLGEEETASMLAIANRYKPRADGVDREYLSGMYPYIVESGTLDTPRDYLAGTLLSLLTFFLVEGLIVMIYFSVFRIIQSENWSQSQSEKKSDSWSESKSRSVENEPAVVTKASKKPVLKKPTSKKEAKPARSKSTPKSTR